MEKPKELFLVKVGDAEIGRFLNINDAKELANTFNFEIIKGLEKAKVFKGTIKYLR